MIPSSEWVIRKQFPILSRKVGKFPLVYLDNAATTQKPLSVLQKMETYYRFHNANVHRGIHQLAEEATLAYEHAHSNVARLIHARSLSEIVFTRGTTDALNMLARMLASKVGHGDEILVSQIEHHSNLIPWQQLAKQKGAVLRFIPYDSKSGALSLNSLHKLITPKTKIVALTHVSNVLGCIVPLKDVISRAHEVNAFVVLDAAQSTAHLPLNVHSLDVDFACFSGHKMYGPTGIGVLFGKESLLSSLDPVVFGGEMVREVYFDRAVWNETPWKFEAGTPPIAEGVGLGAAVDFLLAQRISSIRAHEKKLLRRAYDNISSLSNITVYGPSSIEERSGVLAFSVKGIHPHDVAAFLNEKGIAVRAGHHCAMPLTQLLGVPSTTRASVGIYNTRAEIDFLVESLSHAQKVFKGGL
ncbi:MAG: SufS family cysteine desulfurase [Candidatus Diapherotrites archaeon]